MYVAEGNPSFVVFFKFLSELLIQVIIFNLRFNPRLNPNPQKVQVCRQDLEKSS